MVLAEIAAWTAGDQPGPPADLAALPVGMQAMLMRVLPETAGEQRDPDPEAAARLRVEAESLANEWATLGMANSAPARAPATVSLPRQTTAAALLAGVLAQTPDVTPLSSAATAMLRLLKSGPCSVREVRDLARAHGRLAGSVLEEIDRVSVVQTGKPCTWWRDDQVGLCDAVDGGEPGE